MATTAQRPTGAEDVAWDLSDLFAGADDAKLEAELADVARSADAFRERWLAARNLANEAPDETVEALVAAVVSRYDIPQRYYRRR